MKKDPESRLCCAPWLFPNGIVTSRFCAFSASFSFQGKSLHSLLEATACLFTFCVKRNKLELAFWHLFSMHAVIQVPPDGVVDSRNCRCHSFAACTVWPCVSAARPSVLSPWASHTILHSRHPAAADCILPILVTKLAVSVFSATAIPSRFFASMGFFCHSNTSLAWTFLHPVLAWSPLPMYCRKAGGCLPCFPSPWYKSFRNSPHRSMYHAVEPLPYSGHSLYQLVIFICWFVSKLLSHDPGVCAPPADPSLIAFRTPLFPVDFWSSYLTVPPFRRGSCHVKTARFVLSCQSVGTSLPEIALSVWMSASSFARSPRCDFTLTRNVAVPAIVPFRSS